MTGTGPLTNDADLHLRHEDARFWRRVCRHLAHVCVLFEPTPLGRRVVDGALKTRSSAHMVEWNETYGMWSAVMTILFVLKDIGGYPSERFLPGDSLLFVVRCSGIDWYAEQVFCELEDRFGSTLDQGIMQRALTEDWTIGRFVKEILEHANNAGEVARQY